MNKLLDNFQKYIAENDLTTTGDRILLTVSGGADSMVMLTLFVESGFTSIGVAHCNFGLRGAESDGDETLVAAEVARLGLPFYCKRFDTQAEMERTGESMEMAARRLRYAWFEELRRREGYDLVAVAHHADDSIETFFINLLRGTGLRGLTGISSHFGHIIRPLMFASRKEIHDYAQAHRIPFREDSSNQSTKYLRNKVRLGVIPRMREIHPKFTFLMRRNLRRLADAQHFIDHTIDCIRQVAVTSEGGVDTICVEQIDKSYPRGFVIYELLNSTYGFKGDVIDALCRALRHGATGKRFYSREFVACIDRGNIVVTRIAEDDDCATLVERDAVRSYCGNSVLYYELCDVDAIATFGVPPSVALLDADLLHFPLELRRWHEGDWFVPFGMAGHKKVSDYLIDAKVSMAEKQRQFVLVSGGDIVWLVGHRINDRYRITSQTDNVLRITKETL